MNVAQSVRLDKEKRPEDFCSNPRCLWNVARSGHCPKHMRPIECLYCFKEIQRGEYTVSVNKQRDHRCHVGDCERHYREDRRQDALEREVEAFEDVEFFAQYGRERE